jgi:putative ABC transport system permease protein
VLASIPRNITPEQIRAQLASGTLAKTPEEFAAQAQANAIDQELTIVAVSKKPTRSQPGTELYILTPIEEARRLNDLSLEGTTDFRTYNFVLVKVEDGKDPAKLSAAQQKLKDLGYQVRSVKETQEFLTNIIGVLQGIVAGFAFIAIIASIFGIINTMYISVLQRTREIGLMKALGMRKRDIGRLFRFEAAWIGFLGGVVGSALAVALGLSLNPWITRQLNLGEGNNILIFNPIQIAVLVGSLMFISILAGWLPSRKAAKLDPIEALRAE